MKKTGLFIALSTLLWGCNTTTTKEVEIAKNKEVIIEEVEANCKYGYDLNQFEVINDTIRSGNTFGGILENHGVSHAEILKIANDHKDIFDVRKIREGRPYAILKSGSQDNAKAEVFIYENNTVEYTLIQFADEIKVENKQRPVVYKEQVATGVITSSLARTMQDQNLSPLMTEKLSNIYAWTINFFRLQEGDRFKVVYTQKYVDDTLSVGLGEIKAAVFEHAGKPIYSFNFESKESEEIHGYYDDEGNNLRRAFLKAPVEFSRISSRYNLNRRIAYYNYQVRPHFGTDFAAPIGTPILATADGVVSESTYRGGNGNFVKIRHNGTYETQYLHMKSRNVKVGDYVKQGDVIGWIGMTGNTSGPHVCYRFWKNGKQVDPFKEDLPASEPLPENFQEEFMAYITPFKEKLDKLEYDNILSEVINEDLSAYNDTKDTEKNNLNKL